MSLINDALKRAAEADQQRTGDSAPATPLQPVDHPPRRNWAGWVVLLVLLGGTLAFAAIHLGRWAGGSGATPPGPTAKSPPAADPASSASVTAATARPAVQADTNLTPRRVESPPLASPVAPTPVADQVPTAPPSAPTEGAPVPAAVVETRFPELKLQSIVFRLRNPSVLINGQMLNTGDTVEGARVVRIERHAVTMEWQGQTKLLRLPEQ
jgi:hypothetical protein